MTATTRNFEAIGRYVVLCEEARRLEDDRNRLLARLASGARLVQILPPPTQANVVVRRFDFDSARALLAAAEQTDAAMVSALHAIADAAAAAGMPPLRLE